MFENFNKEDKKKLLVVMIITDGYFGIDKKYPNISYWSNDKILIKIFIDLMKGAFGIIPSHQEWNNVSYSKSQEVKSIYFELIKLCRDIKKQSEKISLDFLKESSNDVVIAAIRLAMSTEGSLSISRKLNGSIRGKLAFACANPKLCGEWSEVFKLLNIRMNVGKDKNVYSGVHGLQTVREDDILNFEKTGGFIDYVKVQRGYRFKQFNKNDVLKAYTNFIKNKREGKLKLYTKMSPESFWEKIEKYAG